MASCPDGKALSLYPRQRSERHALVGVTSDVARRIWEHKTEAARGFTQRYGIRNLVHVEFHETMPLAIAREKQIKKWRRAWKLALIEEGNPGWRDLSKNLLR